MLYGYKHSQSLLAINYAWVYMWCSELSKKPVEGFSAGLVDDEDLFKWEILIMGPQDTY